MIRDFLFPFFLILVGCILGVRFLVRGSSCRGTNSPQKTEHKKEKDGYSPLRALTVSLAGTLGVGNLTGVAAALCLGGCGALFWMWVSAVALMPVKYAETVLAVRTRQKRINPQNGKTEFHGGPPVYLRLLPCGKLPATLFSVLCIVASFIQGNLIQTNAVCSMLAASFSVPYIITAIGLMLCAAVFLRGGRGHIGRFTEIMIPFMTILYLLMGGSIILRNAARLPALFSDILYYAFSPRPMLYGAGAGAVSFLRCAMRQGCAKGVFSHEAGCGTSPLSHAGAETDNAHRQGLLGITEVAVDTLLLCTVTGLVLLLSGVLPPTGNPAAEDYGALFLDAFRIFYGRHSDRILSFSVCFYAFSTLITWSYYGMECISALTDSGKIKKAYVLFFSLCTLLGAFRNAQALFSLSDILTQYMTILNTTGVFLLFTLDKTDLLWYTQKRTEQGYFHI